MGVIIGMDPHKRSATVEVIDEQADVLAAGRYGTDKAGYADMLRAGRRFSDRVWAIEGCNGAGRHIAHRLVADGETVMDVPAKLSAQVRVFATGNGRKTDPVDAHSVALAALRSPMLRRSNAGGPGIARAPGGHAVAESRKPAGAGEDLAVDAGAARMLPACGRYGSARSLAHRALVFQGAGAQVWRTGSSRCWLMMTCLGSAAVVLSCSLAGSWAGLVPWSCPLASGNADLGRQHRQVGQILGGLG
jgi:Transposase